MIFVVKILVIHDAPIIYRQKTNYYCSAYGEGIYEGEEYIANDNGEFRHYECFYGMRDYWDGWDMR